MQPHNRLTLQASIASKEQLRYTPAGTAVLCFTVAHRSRQSEAGQGRDVALSIDCVAIGEQAQSLEQIPPDSLMELKGFLANRSNKSRWVVFHVTEFDLK